MKRSLIWAVVCLFAAMSSYPLAAQTAAEADESAAAAQTPQASVLRIMRFSGSLPGAQGQSIAGPVGVAFALYAEQEGGMPLWLETQNVSLDPQGRYTALLGSTSNEGLPLELFSSGEARWLSIQVQGQPEQPRILLVSVPYALRAEEAQRLAGREASEFLLTEQLESDVQQVVETKVVEEMEAQGLVSTEDGVTRTITDGASTFTDNTTTQVVQVTQNGTGRAVDATSTTGNTIEAESTGTSGTNFTLLGINRSTGGRALFGFASATSGNTIAAAGRADSTHGIGFFGQALATSGPTAGVQAEVRSASGTAGVFVNTAGGKILAGRSTGGTEVLSVDGNGTIETDGDVTANAFVGDGSGLTGLSAWSLTGNGGTTAGTNFVGTTDNVALELHVNGARALRLEPGTTPNVIGGVSTNTVAGGVRGATIAGGGDNFSGPGENQVTADFGSIGGGQVNIASGVNSTVAGGDNNTASGESAVVAGGRCNRAGALTAQPCSETFAAGNVTSVGGGLSNLASGFAATVGGGELNTASGAFGTVPGGNFNQAQGNYSFAAGRRAKADHDGAFVWGDSTDADFTSTANDQFLIRAAGGVGIGTASPAATLDVERTTSGDAITAQNTSTSGISRGLSAGTKSTNVNAAAALLSAPSGAKLIVGVLDTGGGSSTKYRLDSDGNMVTSGDVTVGSLTHAGDVLDLLDVHGDVRVGTGTTGCVKDRDADVIAGTCSSDLRLKKNVQPFPPLLDMLVQLTPVHFFWRADEFPQRHLGSRRSFGLVAQEVQPLFPDLVTEDREGFKAVNYSKLPLLLLQAIKEQQAQIRALQAELAVVKAALTQSDDDQLAALNSQE